ncbi:hypothetical protein ACRE_087550 [Hapsidospora chrysogenum ATCC 11550]|uniref:Aldehyde dehydrogenase domain-containing protein n=1 Tax=Hapsidospora chrysogenum (strain ATCC 11550 / CBS 779.69 / DSM 880 / IAM 14645 / JCM 23072 / IMI 49137) TaxID=857340 RepID=A0A086STX2_HAPC1|nr:hypothetical protein ACRE_087550 [Hapsidospora chrysogenum ATCC 11550]
MTTAASTERRSLASYLSCELSRLRGRPLALTNDTIYGFSDYIGNIFTKDIARILSMKSKMEVGTLYINTAQGPAKETSWAG